MEGVTIGWGGSEVRGHRSGRVGMGEKRVGREGLVMVRGEDRRSNGG